jgi:hypothetical protein
MNEGASFLNGSRAHIFYNISVYKGIMDGGKIACHPVDL